jgi:hypothetical protein
MNSKQNFNFMVRRIILRDFVVRQKFFLSFMVRELQKFGKHWSNLT